MASAQVLFHSSIRIAGEKVVYFDPFKINGASNDADIIFITHDHYDHFSPEDIRKVKKDTTVFVVPVSLTDQVKKMGTPEGSIVTVIPGQNFEVQGIQGHALAAYNVGKPFHPKANNWVGYVVCLDGVRYYVAGDTDQNPDNDNVSCDVAFIPIGGTYTMDVKVAAKFVNKIQPKKVIPTHYGSVVGSPHDGKDFAGQISPDILVEIQM